MVLPKAGLNGFGWTFVQDSTIVLELNFFLLKFPAFDNTQPFGGDHLGGPGLRPAVGHQPPSSIRQSPQSIK